MSQQLPISEVTPPGEDDACLDLRPRPLTQLVPMQVAEILAVDGGDAETGRLKALGLCVGRKLQVTRPGDPLIVRVLGSRVGISRRLAERVHVRACMRTEGRSDAPQS